MAHNGLFANFKTLLIEASLARDNKAALLAHENYSVKGQSVTKFSNGMNKRKEGCFSWMDASFSKSKSFISCLNGAQMSGHQTSDFNHSP